MTTRHCPSCAVARIGGDIHENAYTVWKTAESIAGIWGEQCINDPYAKHGYVNSEHGAYIKNGAYRIICGGANGEEEINRGDANGELTITCWGEGCPCAGLFASLVKAMEREAADGVLDPDMWALTFPRRTGELVEEIRKKVAAALADKLPVVLVGIVSACLV